MTKFSRTMLLAGILGTLSLLGCSPYYGDLADHEKRELDRARAAKEAGDLAGSCAMLAEAAAGSAHPSVLIQYARCLMDADAGEQDLARAGDVLERAYAVSSQRRGRAALWLGILEQRRGGSPAAQVAWLERARALGEPGTDRLLVRAWRQDPRTYRAELVDAYQRTAATDAYSALELARLLAADPATNPSLVRARSQAAVRALETGARAGNGGYARTLAWLHRTGEFVPKSEASARDWLTIAARAGDPKALLKLAWQEQAEGDAAAAQQWLEQAVAAGDRQAAEALSRGYLTGRFQPASLTDAEELIARTAETSPALLTAYGEALLTGSIGRRDPQAGLARLELAAADGYGPARTELGRRYLRGADAPIDVERGHTLLEASADQGDASAMFYLARAYLDGRGVTRNPAVGIDWLRRGAEAGSNGARLELARRQLRGLDLPVDVAGGRERLEAMAAAGHAGAMLELGKAYAEGAGLRRNPALARKWLGEAAKAGNQEAKAILQA